MPRWRARLANKLLAGISERDAERGRWLDMATRGITNRLCEEAEAVAGGYDFAGFAGNGGVDDDEMIRMHLLRTKRVVDASPQMVSAYGNARQLSGMLGYVLDRWDTAEREDAIEQMADLELSEQSRGAIDLNVAGDYEEPTGEDATVVDNYDLEELRGTEIKSVADGMKVGVRLKRKGGLFNALRKVHGNSRLTQDAKDVVASNPVTQKISGRVRSAVAKQRIRKRKNVGTQDGEVKQIVQAVASVGGLSGLGGVDVDTDTAKLLNGEDLEYMVSGADPVEAYRTYIRRTYDVAMAHPEYFETTQEQKYVLQACNAILSSWDDERLRDKVFEDLLSGLDEDNGPLEGKLRKKLKKAVKKIGSGIKKAVKTTGKAVKKAVKAVGKGLKKVGKAIAKVAKKVWKFLVRFNPLTLLIRAGIMAICRLNMFKIAKKCYPGSLTESEAKSKLGIDKADWETYKKCYDKLSSAYTKLGGKESKLRSCLEKGSKKSWSGVEYPTSEGIKQMASSADDPETQKEMDAEKAELAKQGTLTEDKTMSAESAPKVERKEVEVIENERTAKNATPIRETGESAGKVLATVPKGTKVLVDTKQGDATWVAATYMTHTGWVRKEDLAGIGGMDAESTLVMGLGGLYDEGCFSGLGDPATGTAITAATGVITTILGAIKTIMDKAQKAKEVVDKTKDVIKTGKGIVDSVRNKDYGGAVAQAGQMMTTTSDVVAQTPLRNTQATQGMSRLATSAQGIMDKAKGAISNVKSAVSNVKNVVSNVKGAVSNVKNAVQSGGENDRVQTAPQAGKQGEETKTKNDKKMTITDNMKTWLKRGIVALAVGGLGYGIYKMSTKKTTERQALPSGGSLSGVKRDKSGKAKTIKF